MTIASRLLVPVILSGTFVQLFSVTVMQVAVVDVRRDLGAGAGESQLVLAGYTLTYACSLIVSARLGDRYGYRRMFVAGMALFTAASLGAAVAPSAWLLVVGRLVQGVGSGLMAPQILSIIQSALPASRRPAALSAFGATMAAASMAGPVLGGVLMHLHPLGWRAAMLLVVPVGVLALVLSPVLPHVQPTRGAQRIDPVGAGLSLTGLVLLVLPLTAGRDAGWPMWTWLSLASAVVLLTGFAVSQRKVADPLVHPATLADPATRWGLAIVLVFNAGVPSFTLLLSMHLQGEQGWGPLQTGLGIIPYAVGALVGSGFANVLGRRFGPRVLAASALAMGLMAIVVAATIDGPRWPYWFALCLSGIGFGVFTASAFTQIITRVGAEAATSISGLLPTAQQLGGTVGVTLAGIAYSAAENAMWHAMAYEATVFALAAICATRLTGARTRCRREAAPTSSKSSSVS
ncbi:drug resistance transporter, EmrB/QacA subfamily [Saccharopolyspora kobensis]|uniref:Drug resistance transporter, EmrB/QacA subfamily n=1 Tax=Saccharopolyspora kobensis TaxID=146035 RepID=A0A1H6AJW1_9PSEU|nr:MFS transporter [Saccharopolyspora kobensis]SEG48357.1 drug resistance transporter, EmrB/QacA subfamily [Saccharopolyspora kobensis]SFE57692.1 drug resistance transporter, EmrB/QacA subfamily [Saccharopolyspora kobensis]